MRQFLIGASVALIRAGLPLVMVCAAATAAPAAELPGRYFRLMEAELAPVAKRLEAEPKIDLKTLEAGPNDRHFPGTILAAAVLYAKEHPANPSFGDKTKLALALRIGD